MCGAEEIYQVSDTQIFLHMQSVYIKDQMGHQEKFGEEEKGPTKASSAKRELWIHPGKLSILDISEMDKNLIQETG